MSIKASGADAPDNLPDPLDILRKYWGYPSFRPLQREIVDCVLSGRDTLGLMPTGGGKSITFQVPGLCLEGITLVVTPLISLMKDQVDNLRKRKIQAVYFHSAMTRHENTVAWEKIVNGRARFIYVAPERLGNARFIDDLRRLPVKLLVVDEAHCICQWGYDFRPSYLNIASLRKIFTAPVMALTATATPDVAEDIRRKLEFREGAETFRMSFSRQNISYVVRHSDAKVSDILHILSRTSGSAIVYVRSRKRTREIADSIASAGISATYYHAGLDIETKEKRQNAWSRGETRVIVATNAFGMGIDKPDVRVVIHSDMPPSLEEYYQEAGRAGRDGLPSYAVLLEASTDKGLLHRRLTEAFPEREDIRKTYGRACTFMGLAIGEGNDTLHEFDIDRFCEVFKLQPRFARACFKILGQAGYLEFQEETDTLSRVKILCHRDELYNLRLSSKAADEVLLQLLRLYPGLFADYVYINEDRIARTGGLDPQQVYTSLLELGRAGALSYIPKKRTPLMYVPTAREELKYIVIGKSIYEERREVMSRRIEAMIDYACNGAGCRVSRMLAYFGEEDAKDCGTCDVCRGKRKSRRQQRRGEEATADAVWAYLKEKPDGVNIHQLAAAFGIAPERITEALAFLRSQGYVTVEHGVYGASPRPSRQGEGERRSGG